MSAISRTTGNRIRHRWLYALPSGAMPERVDCGGQGWTLRKTFKHDFFAATGLYLGDDGREAVLKIGRVNDVFSLPGAWMGRFLTGREVRLYGLSQGLPGVPELIGRVGETGFMHAFVPGHALERREVVGDAFFGQLQALVAALHSRHMAYVDLNKRQNILMGDDGRPHLIDFQISLHMPPIGWRRLWPLRWLLRRCQQADDYHVLKHKRRLRPDQLTDAERRVVERISVWIRLHRVVARPVTLLRRRTLKRLARSETEVVAGSSAK